MAFSVYFMSTIETLGWNWLVYTSESYYIHNHIEKFYNGFAKSDISNHRKSFNLQWQYRIIIIVHVGAISAITGILPHNGNQIPFVIEGYPTKMAQLHHEMR